MAVRVDDDDASSPSSQGYGDRVGQPTFHAGLDDEPVHDDLDRVVLPAIELQIVLERVNLTVHAHSGEPLRPQRASSFLNSPFRPRTNRRQNVIRSSVGPRFTRSTIRSTD